MTAPSRTLAHVTLSSGHVRASPRSEVRDDVLARLEPLLVQALLRGERAGLPETDPRCTITGAASVRESRLARAPAVGPRGRRIVSRRPAIGEAVILTVWGPPSVDTEWIAPPIVTFGVAPSETGALDLWQALHLGERHVVPMVTDPADPPAAPWCAARLEVGALIHPEALHWIADLERCMAWAWIEMMEGTP